MKSAPFAPPRHTFPGRTAVALAALLAIGGVTEAEDRYKPTWESLSTHPVPKWFRDAKFGIYTHWGIYSVPAGSSGSRCWASMRGCGTSAARKP